MGENSKTGPKDIPIIFSGAMVNALLSGRKTMTRRMFRRDKEPPAGWDGTFGFSVFTGPRQVELRGHIPEHGPVMRFMAMKYAKGDRLWVRETIENANNGAVGYPADGTWLPNTPWEWRRNKVPSIHMPRRLSRLTLEITSTKVERLNDMTEQDAIREGVVATDGNLKGCFYVPDSKRAMSGTTAVECFARFWDELHGEGAWAANPEVVGISFRVIRSNIDLLPARSAA